MSILTSSEQARHIIDFFELSPFLFVVCSVEGKPFFANKKFETELGWSQNDLLTSKNFELTHPEDREKTQAAMKKLGELESKTLLHRFRTKEGAYKYLEWVAIRRGDLVYNFGRNANEEQLRLEGYEALIDNLPLALFAKDAENNFRFTHWNKMAESLFGLTKAQIIGKCDFDFFPESEAKHFRKKDEQVINEGVVVRVAEEPVTSKEGQTKWVRTYKNAISMGPKGHTTLLGVSEDITDLHNERRKTEEAQRKLVSAARLASVGEMSVGIAHEINNPLAIIKGKLSSLKRRSEGGLLTTADLQLELSKLNQATDRITAVIQSLNLFTSAGENETFATCPIYNLISEVASVSRERFKSSGVELKMEASPDLLVPIKRASLGRALAYLLINSLEAVKGLEVSWVEIRAISVPDLVRITITDSGKGIPAQAREKIFEPFFTTKPVGRGMGLGLSIVHGGVEANNGVIYINSECPNTQFVIELPNNHVSKNF